MEILDDGALEKKEKSSVDSPSQKLNDTPEDHFKISGCLILFLAIFIAFYLLVNIFRKEVL